MKKRADCDDYANAIQTPQLIKATILSGGKPDMNGIRPVMYAGGYCVVFPYHCNQKKVAVRCWHAYLEDSQERTRKISEYLKTINLPYFVDFQYIEEGIATPQGVMPIVVMDWVDAMPLKEYIEKNLSNSDAIKKLAQSFMSMAADLHAHRISHGDLQHGNIMVTKSGQLILVDYDSMSVPELEGEPNYICGLQGYQHPSRWSYLQTTPKADYFSELIIYTAIMALSEYPSLWDKYKVKDTNTLLFEAEDLASVNTSSIFSDLRKNEYLSQLGQAIIDFLSKSTLEELSPLEEIEPNRASEKYRNQILNQLEELRASVQYQNIIEKITTLIDTQSCYSVDDLRKEYLLIEECLKKEEEIQDLREAWSTNGNNVYQPTVIDTSGAVEEMKGEWEEIKTFNGCSKQVYDPDEINKTKNEW